MKEEKIKKVVRTQYGRIASQKRTGCCSTKSCCATTDTAETLSKKAGYTDKDLTSVPEGANLGLGCGNPVALASLKEGNTVLDLGSGAGFDCFLASNRVGKTGRVIGVDMTPEMIKKAKANAKKCGYENVDFRLGEIEDLPVEDNSVDVIISNCVINLSPDKKKVFREAFRVLRPGGRLMVSDIVLLEELPDSVRKSVELYVGCLAGAIMKNDYIDAIKDAGFSKVKILDETSFSDALFDSPDVKAIAEGLNISGEMLKYLSNAGVSIKIQGMKA